MASKAESLEVTQLTSNHLELFEGKPIFQSIMKGHKQHVMSVPEPLVNRLQAYAFRHGAPAPTRPSSSGASGQQASLEGGAKQWVARRLMEIGYKV
jgi:hypothetical protein